MHHDIKRVISTLMTQGPGRISINLSSPQESTLGRLLGLLYYRTNVMDLVDRDCRFGYPHNGGRHTLEYHGPARDAVAMVEIFKETLEENFPLNEEESQVASELSFISQEILALSR